MSVENINGKPQYALYQGLMYHVVAHTYQPRFYCIAPATMCLCIIIIIIFLLFTQYYIYACCTYTNGHIHIEQRHHTSEQAQYYTQIIIVHTKICGRNSVTDETSHELYTITEKREKETNERHIATTETHTHRHIQNSTFSNTYLVYVCNMCIETVLNFLMLLYCCYKVI